MAETTQYLPLLCDLAPASSHKSPPHEVTAATFVSQAHHGTAKPVFPVVYREAGTLALTGTAGERGEGRSLLRAS
jgi:hypothetical protein